MGDLIVFLDGPVPGFELKAVYIPELVVLSYIVASIAAFTALDFAGRMVVTRGDRTATYGWLVGGACAMGAGIWCMHFVAMLAFRLPLPVRYDLPITLLSMLFAIVISGFALLVVNHRDVSKTRLLLGGVIMGLGICTMHYTGMIAMHMDAVILYRRDWFLLSIVNAIVCSTIALWLVSFLGGTTQRVRPRYNVMAAMMMGVAICGMHYTAMYAAVCVSTGRQTQPLADIDPNLLGTMIGGVTIAIMGAALAVSLWTISRRLERQNLLLTGEIAERRRAEAMAARDVAERKKSEMQLLESEARLRAILAAAVDAIIIIDTSGTIESLNTAAEKLFGYTALDMVGQNVKMLMPAPYKAEHDGYLHNYTTTGAKKIIGIGREVVGLRKNGGTFPMDLAVSEVQTGGRRLFTGIVRDVTERKRLDQALQEKNAELESARSVAEKANLAKSDFLSSMSHELRTPLNAILGFAQLIESGSPLPTPSQKARIGQILKAGWYLLELINEILDLALIESGKLALSLEPISLTEVVRECQAMVEPQAQTRDIRMTFSQFEIPYFVNADRTRMKQVLINLISNAIKYNKVGGTVVVDYTVSTPGRVRICVKDTGEGLTPDNLTHLFQPFNRLGQEAGIEEGTGIGLIVSKRLVELMGGVIGVESTVGKGSVFWIELNLTAEPQPAAAEPTAVPQAQVRADARLRTLLYVEDNPANLMLVEDLIARRHDMRLLSARNGTLGIDLARASQPEVILMDINLPGMSGIKAMQILRADTATAHIPVVALSANAIPRDIERGLEAGFFRYLTKPIKANEFMEALDVALEYAETRVGQGK